MHLDRDLGYTDFGGYLFVQKTPGYLRHYLLLARRQCVELCPQFGYGLLACVIGAGPFKRDLYSVEKILVAKGFGQEFNCAGLHGLNRHGDVAMTGDENNRNLDLGPRQFRLEVEAAHPRQPDIENKAAGSIRSFRCKKLRGRRKCFDPQSYRPDQIAHRATQ